MKIFLFALFILLFTSATLRDRTKSPEAIELEAYELNNVDTLVDIGCQNGAFSKEIAKAYPRLFMILEDFAQFKSCKKGGVKCKNYNTVDELRKMLKNTRRLPDIESRYMFVAGKIDSIPLRTNGYNRVICRRTVHEFDKPKEMVAELHRILSDTGMLTIAEVVPKYHNQHDEYCLRKYLTPQEVLNQFTSFHLIDIKTIPHDDWTMNIYNFKKK